MPAKKRAKRQASKKALPTVFNLEQLDEEMRVALAFTKRPGIGRYGDGPPFVYPQQRERLLRASKKLGLPKRTVMEDVPWTQAQRDTITATLTAHVADPNWGEKQDARAIRLILTDNDLDAVIALDPATLNAQGKVTRKLALAVRALARMERGETI